MQERLQTLQGASITALYTKFAHASEADGRAILERLRDSGFDLGYHADESDAAAARVDAIYEHARLALYAVLDERVLRDALGEFVSVRTLASDRDDYLAHPPRGERLAEEDAAALSRVCSARRRPQVQLVVSDGLNADAVNEQIPSLLPALRRRLADIGVAVGELAVVVTNGRVRAGYHVAQRTAPDALVHVIGERPGTGLNTASAYLTYGRDRTGHSRWRPDLDHSCTTAVCGIHPRGKPAGAAAAEIARSVARMLGTGRSGVDTSASTAGGAEGENHASPGK
jgi:ethanolamine ammonia-lyase large subunit